jgi:hypothetical protein
MAGIRTTLPFMAGPSFAVDLLRESSTKALISFDRQRDDRHRRPSLEKNNDVDAMFADSSFDHLESF